MNSKYIIIVVLLIVLGGGYFLFKNQSMGNNTQASQINTQQTTPSTQGGMPTVQAQSNTVEYGSNGFAPNSITVKVGSTVTWMNKDTDKLWVASNPHPTHTGYPGFDALKGIPTGETYSFTFTKAGTWGYHNHLEPDKKGEVVVTQ